MMVILMLILMTMRMITSRRAKKAPMNDVMFLSQPEMSFGRREAF